MKIFIFLFSLFLSTANAQSLDDKYFTIKKVKRSVEVKEEASFTPNDIKIVEELLPLQSETEETDPLAIIETFTKVWQIIEDNKPVVNNDTDKFANALPAISQINWSAVGGWQPERNVTVTIVYTNYYGMEVIRLQYQVKMVYGGNVRGKGLYIASAKIIPTQISVAWGYTLNVVASAPLVLNARTPQDPLAVIYLNLNYVVSTIVKTDSVTDTYQVQGDGLIKNTKNNRLLFPAALK